MTRAAPCGVALGALALVVACSNDKPPPASRPLTNNGFVVGAAPTGDIDAALKVPPHEALPVTGDASPYFISTVTKKVEVVTTPQVDPDQAVLADARVSAASCFTGINNGPPTMSASIRVTVVPTGTVTRSAATATTSDEGVIHCLEGVGDGLHFSDKSDKATADIRTYSIDVVVNRNH